MTSRLRRVLMIWVAAFGSGCLVAFIMGMRANGYEGSGDPQSTGFFLGLAGVILGLVLAFGLSPTRGGFGLLHVDNLGGDRVALPTVGIALTLFCLPTFVAAMIA